MKTRLVYQRSLIEQAIEILEQEKEKYIFIKGRYNDPGTNKRCSIGLILSHFGWDGFTETPLGSFVSDPNWFRAWSRAGNILQLPIVTINDASESYDEVISKLKEILRFQN